MTLRIVLPLPDRVLSPNARPHWARLSRAKRSARHNAWLLAVKALREAGMKSPRWEKAHVRMTFYWPTRHKRDADNAMASMKASLDGLADAGVVADDAGFVHWPAEMRHDPKNPRVEVSVEPLEASEAA